MAIQALRPKIRGAQTCPNCGGPPTMDARRIKPGLINSATFTRRKGHTWTINWTAG